MNSSSLFRYLPVRLPVLVALIAIGSSLHFLIETETPLGSIHGQIYLTDSMRPISGADVYLRQRDTEDVWGGRLRRVHSHKSGSFSFTNVPAGEYDISASTDEHSVSGSRLTVSEGEASLISIGLQRTEPAFSLTMHQRIFESKQKPELAVNGYADSSKPIRQDYYRLIVYKTKLSNVMRDSKSAAAFNAIGSYNDTAPKLSTALLHPEQGSTPLLLLNERVRITQVDREGFFYQRFKFPKLTVGLYLLNLKHGRDTACNWLLVTDTAMVVKRAGSELLAYVADMRSGAPISNSEVRFYRRGQAVSSAVTGKNGLAEMRLPALPAGEAEGNGVVAAERGKDETVVQGDQSVNESQGRYAVYAYTDRPIYRPGQHIYYKVIARERLLSPDKGIPSLKTASFQSDNRYSVPAGKTAHIEVRDPNGIAIYRTVRSVDSYGSFHGDFSLLKEAVTGVYTLNIRIGDHDTTHDIVIASYRKPEYTVKITSDKPRYFRGQTVKLDVHASYYFGAPVAEAQVTYNVYSSPDWEYEFSNSYGYDGSSISFNNSSGTQYYGSQVAQGMTTLDANGHAVIQFPAADPNSDGSELPQAKNFTCSVTVQADQNRQVEQDISVLVVSGDFHLSVDPEGYLALPGKPVSVTVTARSYQGAPAANLPVHLDMEYETWNDENNYTRKPAGKLLGVTGNDGKAVFLITPPHGGSLLLIASGVDSGGRIIKGRNSIWVESSNAEQDSSVSSDLSIRTDKRRYQPGETAHALISVTHAGETALVTVEGDRIYRAEIIRLTHKNTPVNIPVLAQYGPNVYLDACYVKDKHFAVTEAPLRVALESKSLQISITPDRKPSASGRLPAYEPEQIVTYTVHISDSAGHPVSGDFSLGVVDEAIYALRPGNPNRLKSSFYPHRDNQVNTAYSFSSQYLGDADKAEPKITARKKFPDTAFWSPDLHTDSMGTARVSFRLPDNLTTWRGTVIAVSNSTQTGYASNKIQVSKPFLVRLEMPRTLTQRDNSEITAYVHNETDRPVKSYVKLQAEGLAITGNAIQQLSVPANGMAQAQWPAAADSFGDAVITADAWTTGSPQLTDGVQIHLPVAPYGRLRERTYAGVVTSAAPQTEALRLDPGAALPASRVTVRITPSLASSLTGGLDYLADYPYGCVEQTVSKLLADLQVRHTLQLGGAADVKGAGNIPQMVQEGLARIYRLQRSDGAWGWWQYDAEDPWMTAYALYGLASAKRLGVSISERALEQARHAALTIMPKTPLNQQPFLLYALAIAGGRAKQVEAARRTFLLAKLSTRNIAYAVLIDHALGRTDPHAAGILQKRLVNEGSLAHWPSSGESDGFYSDDIYTTAISLKALLTVDPRNPRCNAILRWLMAQRTGDYWMDTRDTAMVLSTLCDYLRIQPSQKPGGNVEITLNGKVEANYNMSASNLRETELYLSIPASQLHAGKNQLTLKRAGGNSPVFYAVTLRQVIASENMAPLSGTELGVSRQYLYLAPNGRTTPIPDNKMKSGEPILVRLTLIAHKDMTYVMVEDPFPAGCEVNARGDSDDVTEWNYWWSGVDVRDDRIVFFAASIPKGIHVIEYHLRAQTPGVYNAMPTLVQAMYDPEERAETGSDTVEVNP